MEVDTGATLSIIMEWTQKMFFLGTTLKKANVALKTYTNERMTVMEKLLVQVMHKQQCEHLVIAIVAGDGPSLLIGRNWLKHICLDWNSIWTVTHADDEEWSLKSLLHAHKEFFKDEPGTMCSLQATLHVRPDACLKIFKPQTMPFAINETIEQELDHLEVNGVIGRWHTANGSR